jgi:hypothetical protein
MIQIKYKPLFDLEILHNFYLSGKCPDLELSPTKNCQVLLQLLGLRFLPTEFGGKLFAKVNTVGNKDFIKNPIPVNTRFSFLIRLKKNVFSSFTNLNLNKPAASHYYFNNLVNNLSANSFPLLVADSASKIVSDKDLLPFISNILSHVHNSTNATQSSELKFIDSGESFQQSLENHNNVFNFTYDLNKSQGGRAKLFVEGTEKALMYATEPINNSGLFGVVEIFYKENLPASYQFQQTDNSIETRSYKIAFSVRSTRWRYLVTRKFNQSVTGITIAKTTGAPISFTQLVSSPPTNQFILASNNPLPFKEEPVSGIKLSDQTNKVIVSNLPNPSLGMIKTEGADTFSDILITI